MAGDWATARSLSVQAVGGGLSGLAAQFSDKSALEMCIHVIILLCAIQIDVFTQTQTDTSSMFSLFI